MCLCIYVYLSAEGRGIGCPWVGVTGGGELPVVSAGN